jgi:SAM-dependent methyltransferase
VIATDISEAQLKHAQPHPGVKYIRAPAPIPEADVEGIVGEPGSIDIITVAQALHWFDLPPFYAQVKRMLRNPGGIFAAWCYTGPRVSPRVDEVYSELYTQSRPYWDAARLIVDDEYRHLLPFPFEPVLRRDDDDDAAAAAEAEDAIIIEQPIRFECKREMSVDEYFTYLGSWSAVQTARKRGTELLNEERLEAFRTAWGSELRIVTWPVFLRIGRP